MKQNGKPKVVVVTGASAGVGRAVVQKLAKEGAQIGLIARSEEALEATRQGVEALGGQALVLPMDVSDPDQMEAAAAKVEESFGPIDIWVNNAMVSVFSPVMEMEPAEYKRVTDVTYLGYVYGTLAALKRMKPRDRGVIVQVGSALAYRSIPLQSAYCAAKHAVKGFTESLRTELLHDKSNVKVSMVHLPAVNTPQFHWVKSRLPMHPQPVPPIYQPEVVAEAIVWATEHHPRELLVGYPTLKAILGEKFVPAYADKRLAEMGYEAQQTDMLYDPDRPNNLWEPVANPFGAHGEFDDRARNFSPQLWLRLNWKPVALTAVGLLAMLGTGIIRKKTNGPAMLNGLDLRRLIARPS